MKCMNILVLKEKWIFYVMLKKRLLKIFLGFIIKLIRNFFDRKLWGLSLTQAFVVLLRNHIPLSILAAKGYFFAWAENATIIYLNGTSGAFTLFAFAWSWFSNFFALFHSRITLVCYRVSEKKLLQGGESAEGLVTVWCPQASLTSHP